MGRPMYSQLDIFLCDERLTSLNGLPVKFIVVIRARYIF